MATPADERLLQLLDKWLKSLDLHLKYSSLDDDGYWRVQPWVDHQRPTRWILDLARQKTRTLRAQVEARIKAGDATFADSLELMTFLANLVGSEHIERFIPSAEIESERPLTAGSAAPAAAAAPTKDPVAATAASPSDPAQTGTREMPAFVATQAKGSEAAATATREMPKFTQPPRAAPPVATAHVARSERRVAAPAKSAAKTLPSRQPARKTSQHAVPAGDAASELVIADAVRLVQWGRKWYELPELIARMADRPPLPEVRRILNEHKKAIEAKAGKT